MEDESPPAGEFTVTFTPESFSALQALLHLVHYDDLALAWLRLTPDAIREAVRY